MPPEIKPATETNVPTIAPADDSEAKIAQLEKDKVQIYEEKENYRKAYLKEGEKEDVSADEKEEARRRKIAQETLADSRLLELNREKDRLLNAALKENKELKLAQLNKGGTPSAAIGAHSESTPVRDTSITPDQMAFFKSKGWSDKDIERYKRNLQKRV